MSIASHACLNALTMLACPALGFASAREVSTRRRADYAS